jgi:hypothetical protein
METRQFETAIPWSTSVDQPVEPLPTMELNAPDGVQAKRLASHRRGECLWPLGAAEAIGDWRTLFCCAPVEGARSYCPHHTALAIRPPLEAEAAALVGAA